MEPQRRRRGWITAAIFGALSLLNLVTRDYLGAAGWALIAAALWLRDGGPAGPLPRRRARLANLALGGAVVVLLFLAARLLRRVLA